MRGEWPYIWLDATYFKARRDHYIVSVAVIVAVQALDETTGREAARHTDRDCGGERSNRWSGDRRLRSGWLLLAGHQAGKKR